MDAPVLTSNTILYCRQWPATVAFYRDRLRLPVNFAADWFVEFSLNANSRLSVADERRAAIKSCGGGGITIGLEVDDIQAVHEDTRRAGLDPTAIRRHPWNARVFHLFDPEGHRIEVWQACPPK